MRRYSAAVHAANLPGVGGRDDLELACKLVDVAQVQNTRAGSKRTYHLVISLHPDAERDARATRLLKSGQRERERSKEEREL